MVRVFALLALLCAAAFGQPATPARVAADCTRTFRLTAAPSVTTVYDNRTDACVYWSLTYTSTGFTGVTLQFDAAPDVTGAPGAWAAYPGVLVAGINPNTSITQAWSEFRGYYPWLRVNLSGVVGAGSITGTLLGWRSPSVSAVAVVPGGTPTICGLSAVVTLAGAGYTQIVALTAGQSIRVCHISLSMQAPVDVNLARAPAAACAGPVAITGTYSTVLALALDFSLSPLIVTSANALCVNLGAAVAGGGVVTYAVF